MLDASLKWARIKIELEEVNLYHKKVRLKNLDEGLDLVKD